MIVVLNGPFTEEDLADIVAAMQRIEQRRPEETFHTALHMPDDDRSPAEIQAMIGRIKPLPEGYERTELFVRKPKDET